MITVVGAMSAGEDGTSLTINKPSGTAEGDYLVASIAFDREGGTPAITPPSGWTAIQTEYSGASLWTGYKLAGASEGASYAWSFSGDARNIAGGIIAVRGVIAPAQSSERINTATKNHTANGVTLTSANALLVFGLAVGGWQQNFDPPSGWTERVDQGGGWTSVGMFTKEVTSSGATGDATATTYYDADDVCHLVALPARIYLEASVSGAGSTAGSLTTQIKLVGTSPGAASLTASLTTAKLLGTASSAGVASVTAALTTTQFVTGSSAGVCTVPAVSLTSAPKQFVGSSAGASSATGILSTQIRCAGSSAGTSTATGALTAQIRLAGSSAGAGGATAALFTAKLLGSATSAGSASVTANLMIPIAITGSAAGLATPTGSLTSAWPAWTPGVEPVLECDVYDGASPYAMLATLEGAFDRAFHDPFGDVGSGRFSLPVPDPKATSAILATGNLVKVKLGGVHRYSWWIENPRKIAASPDGKAGERWEIGGRGAIAYLDRAIVYPPGWPSPTASKWTYSAVHAAAILRAQILLAQARGALPRVTLTFTDSLDSDGNAWTDTVTLELQPGMTLLDLWQKLLAMGFESEMSPDLALSMWPSRTRDLSETIVLRAGKHLLGEVERNPQEADIRTRVLVEGPGMVYEERTAGGESGPIGRRESYVRFDGLPVPSTLQKVGDAQLAISAAARKAIAVPVSHGTAAGEYEPYVDYRHGDYVALDVAGTFENEPARVVAITVSDRPGGYAVELDLNSVYAEEEVRLKRLIESLAVQKVPDPPIIADGSITETKIGSGAISTPKLAANAVTAEKISVGAVGGTQIADGAISTGKLQADAVTADKIAAGTITASEIATGAITADKVAADAITADKIAAGAITASDITAGTMSADRLSGGNATIVSFTATSYFAIIISGTTYARMDSTRFELNQGAVLRFTTAGGNVEVFGDSSGRFKANEAGYFPYGIITRVESGGVSDGSYGHNLNGALAVDQSNHRIYSREGGAWRYAATSAGFQVPEHERLCPACGGPLLPGEDLIGVGDREMSDGALHGLWKHARCAGKATRRSIADRYWALMNHRDLDTDPKARRSHRDRLRRLQGQVRKLVRSG